MPTRSITRCTTGSCLAPLFSWCTPCRCQGPQQRSTPGPPDSGGNRRGSLAAGLGLRSEVRTRPRAPRQFSWHNSAHTAMGQEADDCALEKYRLPGDLARRADHEPERAAARGDDTADARGWNGSASQLRHCPRQGLGRAAAAVGSDPLRASGPGRGRRHGFRSRRRVGGSAPHPAQPDRSRS
jgi:hypothetical protein